MMSKLEKEVRILKVYAVVTTLTFGVLLFTAFQQANQKHKFEEIDVERINIVETDAKLKMVISNGERQHPGVIDGRMLSRKRPPGMLFFNEKGDECGGLSFDGDQKDGKASAGGLLAFDRFRQDQTVGIQYGEGNGQYHAGLRVWDRPDTSLGLVIDKLAAIERMSEGPAKTAAMRELRETAGATEILVSDSHGNGENLLIEKFPQDVQIVRAFPRPLMMMEGIDSTFQAAIFIGYHTATTNPAGVRAHTISSANLAAVTLNDVPMSEAGINAAIAGHFGVPVIMISGDDAVVKETQDLLGPLEGAVVKRALGFHSAATLTPMAAQELIAQKVRAALARLQEFKPHVVKAPIKLGVTFKNYRPAEILSYLPIVQRTNAHSIQFTGASIIEVSKFLEFITTYEPGLAP